MPSADLATRDADLGPVLDLDPEARVPSRLLGIVFALLLLHDVDPHELAGDLPSIAYAAGEENGLPASVTSADYLTMVERLDKVVADLAMPAPKPQPKPTQLTARENDVLRFVCNGFTNAEIATALGTAPSTVKSQISSILAKMEVANRTELASLASRVAL